MPEVFFKKGAWLKLLQDTCDGPVGVVSPFRRMLATMAESKIPPALC